MTHQNTASHIGIPNILASNKPPRSSISGSKLTKKIDNLGDKNFPTVPAHQRIKPSMQNLRISLHTLP